MKFFSLALLLIVLSRNANSQEVTNLYKDPGELHGNVQIDAQYYNKDTVIKTPVVPEHMRMNAFANLIYTRGPISAGLRFESYLNPLQGFDPRYQGNGIPFKYLNYKQKVFEITAGSFYEQFGSGVLLRSYEERSLGYDNAFDGVRIKYNLFDALTIKGLVAKQRFFFSTGPGIVRAFDSELLINNLLQQWKEKDLRISLGGSFVSKYQMDDNSTYKLPENVGAGSGRVNLNYKGFAFNSEYAYKINDPTPINSFIYQKGEALIIQSSYSQKGLGISVTAKRIDNMGFRSDRTANLNNLMINYIPATTRQHSYNLLATLYPYASQPTGEMALQTELVYTFKKGTAIGGEYGTTVLINLSAVNSLDTLQIYDSLGYRGYKSDFFKAGKNEYFKEANIEISKKINKKLKLIATYSNILYNMSVVQGLVGKGTIYANVEVLEINYKLNGKNAIKCELQALQTKQDKGDWVTGLVEYSIAPHWFFAVMDQYNIGNPINSEKVHYPIGSVGYLHETHRIQLTYGRQRAGIFCIGGVCRAVPASNGLTITITSSF